MTDAWFDDTWFKVDGIEYLYFPDTVTSRQIFEWTPADQTAYERAVAEQRGQR